MKIIVIGNTQSGKTTAAKLLSQITNSNPPKNCSDFIIRDYAKSNNLDPQEIINNKDKYRKELMKYGCGKQSKDPSYPVKEAFKHTNIVTGTRTKENLEAAKKLADLIIWIGRNKSKPNSTDQIGPEDADIIIDNNGSIDDLSTKLISVIMK